MARKISPTLDPKQLDADLDELVEGMLRNGAAAATTLSVSDVVFDDALLELVRSRSERVSANWPLVLPRDDLRAAVGASRAGVFFVLHTDSGVLPELGCGKIGDHDRVAYRKTYDIVAVAESEAFYMGYHLSFGFAAGNCRGIFCHNELGCRAMRKGRGCIHPYASRPSLTAAGIDSRQLARNLGWLGGGKDPARMLAGLLMVG